MLQQRRCDCQSELSKSNVPFQGVVAHIIKRFSTTLLSFSMRAAALYVLEATVPHEQNGSSTIDIFSNALICASKHVKTLLQAQKAEHP